MGCTAKAPSREVCNGKDDNCDGLVDNNAPGQLARLNCPANNVCFMGMILILSIINILKQCFPSGAVRIVMVADKTWWFGDGHES